MTSVNCTILIVDDELELCLSLKELLCDEGFYCEYETDPREVLPLIEKRDIGLVLLDIRMPEIGGIDLLKILKSRFPDLPVIIISGHATVDTAVRAMKYGAVNLFTKPLDIDGLIGEIRRITGSITAKRSVPGNDKLITHSPVMQKILDLVQKAAPTDATVLITGESGTGKELIAGILHRMSPRNPAPYIRVNCAAIPETLLESEVFGYEQGAFTDAKQRKQGYFEAAGGGTIFLDEIGDMSLHTQAKILRVLQERQFTRVGGTELIESDVRVIAATNKDLRTCIEEGSFREDLFYRLTVINLHLPPLRERTEDIIPLAEYYLNYFNSVYEKKITGIDSVVRSFLLEHNWPGNIRELKNFIERAVIFCTGNMIRIDTIPDQYREIGRTTERPGGENRGENDLAERYRYQGKEVILEALEKTRGVKKQAAELLKIDRKTLYNRMKRFNIE